MVYKNLVIALKNAGASTAEAAKIEGRVRTKIEASMTPLGGQDQIRRPDRDDKEPDPQT